MNTYTLSTKGALEVNSSGGKLLKWKVGDKFIKTSTLDITQMTPKFMYESYAEVIAYHIAKWLGFNCVKYELCNVILDGNMQTIACESEDFTQSNEQYTSIGKLMAEDSIPTGGGEDKPISQSIRKNNDTNSKFKSQINPMNIAQPRFIRYN